jgi:hypothetical protein
MSDDYEFYGGTPPHEHVDTSEEAAERARAHAERQRAQVWAFIYGKGENGATDEELQIEMHLEGNSQRPRRRELSLAGLVVETGRRRLTTKGRWARVRVAREFGPPPVAPTPDPEPIGPLAQAALF